MTEKDQKFRQLCEEIIDLQGEPTLFLSFSTGKDSLAAFLRCYETGLFKKFILYHYYLVEGLSWIDAYLEYFSKKFNVEIISVPSPNVLKMKHFCLLQPPIRIAAYYQAVQDYWPYYIYKHEDLERFIKEDHEVSENVLCAVGVKACDSAMRQMAMKKTGPINENKKHWYPVFDLSNREVAEIIKRHGVKLPLDYKMFGLTIDGLDARFTARIKDLKPDDYKKIEEQFPLVGLMIARRERYHGLKFRQAKFDYRKYDLEILE